MNEIKDFWANIKGNITTVLLIGSIFFGIAKFYLMVIENDAKIKKLQEDMKYGLERVDKISKRNVVRIS